MQIRLMLMSTHGEYEVSILYILHTHNLEGVCPFRLGLINVTQKYMLIGCPNFWGLKV